MSQGGEEHLQCTCGEFDSHTVQYANIYRERGSVKYFYWFIFWFLSVGFHTGFASYHYPRMGEHIANTLGFYNATIFACLAVLMSIVNMLVFVDKEIAYTSTRAT